MRAQIVYSRLYHGPNWRQQLPSADLRNLYLTPRDRAVRFLQNAAMGEKCQWCHHDYCDAIPIMETWILYREIFLYVYIDISIRNRIKFK